MGISGAGLRPASCRAPSEVVVAQLQRIGALVVRVEGPVGAVAQVVDARSGAVLLPATKIRAETPAWSGERMKAARRKGITQKSMITNHVAATIAGWLGLGPDNRGSLHPSGRLRPDRLARGRGPVLRPAT